MFATAVALEEEYFTVQACKGLQSEGVHLFWTEGQGTSLDDLAGGAVRWGWGGGGPAVSVPSVGFRYTMVALLTVTVLLLSSV